MGEIMGVEKDGKLGGSVVESDYKIGTDKE